MSAEAVLRQNKAYSRSYSSITSARSNCTPRTTTTCARIRTSVLRRSLICSRARVESCARRVAIVGDFHCQSGFFYSSRPTCARVLDCKRIANPCRPVRFRLAPPNSKLAVDRQSVRVARRVGRDGNYMFFQSDSQPANAPLHRRFGAMAEWSCRGLQILVRRFDSGSRLQTQT